MATNRGSTTKANFDGLDKVSSSTLKRNPKMELNKTDLLKLLTYLEGELQAREIVIATLKAERVKQLLYQAKYGQFSLNDPFAALQRDSYGAYNPNCDEAAIKAMYNNQLSQLENLILQHRRAQQRLRQHLYDAEQQHGKVVSDLEDEIRKHAQDTAQGDDVTYMLEKERERLHQEVELERQQNKKLERELKKVVQAMEQDKLRHKQIVMLLLEERKRIVAKLIEEHGKNEEMSQFLCMEKGRMADVVEGLEEESKKSLQMEAELEQQAADYSKEREQLKVRLLQEMEKTKKLSETIESLRKELLERNQTEKMRFSETITVKTDDDVSDIDSYDSDTALKTPPTVRENVPTVNNTPQFNSNGNNSSVWPTNVAQSGSLATSSPPAPPAKPSILRSSIAGPISNPSLGDFSPKLVPPRISKSLSPVPSVTSLSSGAVSPNSTTIVKMVRAVTPSPTSPPQQQQCGGPEKPVVRSVVAATVLPASAPSSITPTMTATTLSVACSSQQPPHVVQVTPRVSLTTNPGAGVYTTTQGGKVTFHVTAPPPQPPKKPQQLIANSGNAVGVGRGAPPPVPPNKPILPKKEVGPLQSSAKGPGSLKFGITISKGDGNANNSATSSHIVISSSSVVGGPTVITASSMPTSSTSSSSSSALEGSGGAATIFKETQVTKVSENAFPENYSELVLERTNSLQMLTRNASMDDDDSLAPELADFQQLLVSMATTTSSSSDYSPTITLSVGNVLPISDGKYSSTVGTTMSVGSEDVRPTAIHRSLSSPVRSLSAIWNDWKSDTGGSGGNGKVYVGGVSENTTNVGGSGESMRLRLLDGDHGLNGNVSSNRKSTPAFKPCVRKVVSPTLPKSFNHLDL